jgi:hypothetical protein
MENKNTKIICTISDENCEVDFISEEDKTLCRLGGLSGVILESSSAPINVKI